MNELEQLRAELQSLRAATKKALGLAIHAVGASGDAAPILANLLTNYQAAMRSSKHADDFDELATAMLLTLSSLAVKQHPGDAEILALYRSLRPGERH